LLLLCLGSLLLACGSGLLLELGSLLGQGRLRPHSARARRTGRLSRLHLGVLPFMGQLGKVRFVIGGIMLGLMALVHLALDLVIELVRLRVHHFAQLDQSSLLLIRQALSRHLLRCFVI
jgi:hypothetical protein